MEQLALNNLTAEARRSHVLKSTVIEIRDLVEVVVNSIR